MKVTASTVWTASPSSAAPTAGKYYPAAAALTEEGIDVSSKEALDYIESRTHRQGEVRQQHHERAAKWAEKMRDQGFAIISNDLHRVKAQQLKYQLGAAPRVNLEAPEQYWIHTWLADVFDGDLTEVHKLIAPKHFHHDPEEQRLIVIESLLGRDVAAHLRPRYHYYLELTSGSEEVDGGELDDATLP